MYVYIYIPPLSLISLLRNSHNAINHSSNIQPLIENQSHLSQAGRLMKIIFFGYLKLEHSYFPPFCFIDSFTFCDVCHHHSPGEYN